jgi:hypothetical protein
VDGKITGRLDLEEMQWQGSDWIHVARDRDTGDLYTPIGLLYEDISSPLSNLLSLPYMAEYFYTG